MGSRIFDFLSESLLFRQDLIDEQFARTPVVEIESELERYRDFCIKNKTAILTEAATKGSNLSVYDPEVLSISKLKQAALYVDAYVLKDPLLQFTEKQTELTRELAKNSICPPMERGIQLRDLSRILGDMKLLTPMVAADFVKFIPSSLDSEGREELPIYASNNYFEDALPSELLNLFKQVAHVSTVRPNGDGSFRLVSLRPCRGINIHFKGDLDRQSFMYSLHQIEDASRTNGSANEVKLHLTLPKTAPERDYFQVWVKQSINQAAWKLFHDIYQAAEVATSLGAAYSTHSRLRFDALRKAIEPHTSIPVRTANTFLNLDLPFLKDVDIQRLMDIRRDEGEAFYNFRRTLDFKLSSIRETPDIQTAKKQAEDAVRELTGEQIRDIDSKVRSIREKLGCSALFGVINVAAAVQVKGLGLLAAVAAAFPIASAILEYRKEIKRHPIFFLWKVLPTKSRGPS